MAKTTGSSQHPQVAIITAMTKDRVIGAAGTLPWDLPEDRQLFKRLTTGQTVIMGRRTYESLGEPLPDRHNIVLSRSLKAIPGAEVCRDIEAALQFAGSLGHAVFIIGGTELYRQALPIATELHVTWVEATVPGDTYFPDFDRDAWTVCETITMPGAQYVRYQRKSPT